MIQKEQQIKSQIQVCIDVTDQKVRGTKKRAQAGCNPFEKQKYEGSIDPISRLRHGRGIYHYDNSFFTFQGQYVSGKKNGAGTLKLNDGTVIKGTFVDDQLNGPAQIFYSHGAQFKGNLCMGEKSGEGHYKSMFEEYAGEWKDNYKHGAGTYKNSSIDEQYIGEFQKGKFHGKGKLTKWNYQYEGMLENGLKEGEGREVCDWMREEGKEGVGRYEYAGNFVKDKFEGQGQFRSKQSKYIYKGQFSGGLPTLYPNQFRIYLSANSKNGEEIVEGDRSLIQKAQPLQYEVEGDSINLYIETVFQGPEQLDPIQPTQEEIDVLIKNWQNENKKNKNPPPMPDFNQPRMKKPDLVLVNQQSGRTITLRLLKQSEGKEEALKIDYRLQMASKRKQNEELKQQALKKAEEDAGKKGGKKDNKGEQQLKVNIFKANPLKKETILDIFTFEGKAVLKAFELPDDFPVGKYYLQISSPFSDFGKLVSLKKQINIKSKTVAKKK